MKLHFLGGADEVGASSVLLEAAGRRLLIDAGVRMGAASRDPLPDLARVTELGGLDGVLLTHAHLDHSGAMPLVHGAFPRAPVWMTAPTLSLIRVLLLDALKIMSSRAEQEGEIPLYPLPAVEALLARAEVVSPMEPRSLPFGRSERAWRVTFFPSGHVLGAASVGIETPEGRVLITGDLSVTDQLTVPGMALPRFSPDVVVCESTYGNRLHASRRAEEGRLVTAVVDTLRAGGTVLVPAFALGRAQEVLVLLRKALAAPDAPEARVYFDGMVRSICGVYARHPEWLTRLLRGRAEAGKGLFSTADGRVAAVQDPAERGALLHGPPCVIVSSSGMLSGGPSAQYALGLCGRESALIAITGYQDEEAPGRRLQEVARGEESELVIDGRSVKVRCRVGSFGLSAHADAQEMAGLLERLRPRAVALVHGDGSAREGLAERILSGGMIKAAYLPSAGDELDLADLCGLGPAAAGSGAGPGGRGHTKPGQSRGSLANNEPGTLGRGEALDADGLGCLHAYLLQGHVRAVSVGEIGRLWYGEGSVPDDLGFVHDLLRGADGLFEPDRKRPYLYRPLLPTDLRGGASVAARKADDGRDEEGRLEQNLALALVDELIGGSRGLYRRGADRDTWTLRLFFQFPDVEREACQSEIARLEEESGWAVEVCAETHLGALEQVAREQVQAAGLGPLLRSPSIRVDSKEVTVRLERVPSPEVGAQLDSAMRARTGFSLQVERARAAGKVASLERRDAKGRLEINQAFASIERAFGQDEGPRPLKKSKRTGPEGPFIELGFISPEVGHRQMPRIEDLEVETGWPIRVAERVDQQAVLALVRSKLPADWSIRKGPGLDVAGRTVRLKVHQRPPEQEIEALERLLSAEAGFSLEVK